MLCSQGTVPGAEPDGTEGHEGKLSQALPQQSWQHPCAAHPPGSSQEQAGLAGESVGTRKGVWALEALTSAPAPLVASPLLAVWQGWFLQPALAPSLPRELFALNSFLVSLKPGGFAASCSP